MQMYFDASVAVFFGKYVSNKEIAHAEQFTLLQQYLQFDSIVLLSFIEMSSKFAEMFLKSSVADLLYGWNDGCWKMFYSREWL